MYIRINIDTHTHTPPHTVPPALHLLANRGDVDDRPCTLHVLLTLSSSLSHTQRPRSSNKIKPIRALQPTPLTSLMAMSMTSVFAMLALREDVGCLCFQLFSKEPVNGEVGGAQRAAEALHSLGTGTAVTSLPPTWPHFVWCSVPPPCDPRALARSFSEIF